MRTTIDLPDDLFRQTKARAALRGMTLKDYIARALRDSLFDRSPVSAVHETETEYGKEVLVLDEACLFPLIAGETTAAMQTLTEERLDEILEEEALGSAPTSGGR